MGQRRCPSAAGSMRRAPSWSLASTRCRTGRRCRRRRTACPGQGGCGRGRPTLAPTEGAGESPAHDDSAHGVQDGSVGAVAADRGGGGFGAGGSLIRRSRSLSLPRPVREIIFWC